jgi:hypothetical protein
MEPTELDFGKHPQLSDKRGWLRTLLIQTACFLWLLPIAAILVLNFKQQIIGASAWCPKRDCYVGWFNQISIIPLQNLQNFDRHNHNLLGALQLVAKALEIWFGLIVLSLVYLITFFIAGRHDGLPIGYLMRPSEFANLPGLFDPLLWRLLPSVTRAKANTESRKYRPKIYLFVSITVFLCLLCNLMGPATAVLALPSLQWIDSPLVGNRMFGVMNSGSPPRSSADSLGPFKDTYCTEEDTTNLSFSCATHPFASQLDSWIQSYIASGDYHKGIGMQEGVTFDFNATYSIPSSDVLNLNYSDVTWWAPSRQVLSNLNHDQK